MGDTVVILSEHTAYQHRPQDIADDNEGTTLDDTRTISQRGYSMDGAQGCSLQAEKEDCSISCMRIGETVDGPTNNINNN